MPVLLLLYACLKHVLMTCCLVLSCACLMPVLCLSYACLMPVLCLSYACLMPVLYLSYTCLNDMYLNACLDRYKTGIRQV